MLNTSGENVWTLKGGMQQNVFSNKEEENSAKAQDCHEVSLDLTREEVVTLEEDEESDFSDECEMDFDVSKDLWVKKQRNSSWVEVHIHQKRLSRLYLFAFVLPFKHPTIFIGNFCPLEYNSRTNRSAQLSL